MASSCESGDDFEFVRVDDLEDSFDGAQGDCVARGGSLAILADAARFDALVTLQSDSSRNEHWIGLRAFINPNGSPGNFVNIDASDFDFAINKNRGEFPWEGNPGNGEPNGNNEDGTCVFMKESDGGLLNDDNNCNKDRNYICQVPCVEVTLTPTLSPTEPEEVVVTSTPTLSPTEPEDDEEEAVVTSTPTLSPTEPEDDEEEAVVTSTPTLNPTEPEDDVDVLEVTNAPVASDNEVGAAENDEGGILPLIGGFIGVTVLVLLVVLAIKKKKKSDKSKQDAAKSFLEDQPSSTATEAKLEKGPTTPGSFEHTSQQVYSLKAVDDNASLANSTLESSARPQTTYLDAAALRSTHQSIFAPSKEYMDKAIANKEEERKQAAQDMFEPSADYKKRNDLDNIDI